MKNCVTERLSLLLMVVLALLACQPQKPISNILLSEKAIISKADSFFYARKMDSALVYHQQARVFLSPKNPQTQVEYLNRLANIYLFKDDTAHFRLATDSTLQILQTQTPDFNLGYVNYYLNKTNSYLLQMKIDSAKKYFQFTLDFCTQKKIDSPSEMAKLHHLGGYIYMYLVENEKALQFYQKALSFAPENSLKTAYLKCQIYQDLGYLAECVSDNYQAEKYYQNANEIAKKFLKGHDVNANTLSALARVKLKSKKYNTAQNLYEDALHILKNSKQNVSKAQCYGGILNVLAAKGETTLAIEYGDKALQEYKKAAGDVAKWYVGPVYNDLANAYIDKLDYQNAEQKILLAQQNFQSISDSSNMIVATLNAGIISVYENDFANAQSRLAQTLVLDKKFKKTASWISAQALHWQGVALQKAGKKAEALQKFEESLALIKTLKQEKTPETSEIYLSICEMKEQEKNYAEALKACQKGISAVLYDFSAEDFSQNPSLKGIISLKHLLAALRKKANLLDTYYKENGNEIKNLELCLQTRELALNLVDSIRIDYQATSSKLLLMSELLPLYEASIQTAMELHEKTKDAKYLEKAFLYAERNKATLLNESLQSLKATQEAGIPDSLVNQINDLKTDIGFFENQLYGSKNPDSLKTLIFDLKEKLKEYTDKMENNFPNYYHLRYQVHIPSIAELQEKAKREQADIVEYFVGDSAAYIFCLNEKGVFVQKISVQNLTENIEKLRNLISSNKQLLGNQPLIAFEELSEVGYKLHELLIQPIEKQLLHKKLIIIPDGNLGYIPFEVLLSSWEVKLSAKPKINYQNLPYLIKEFAISYAYSANLWWKPLNQNEKENANYVAFAPSFAGRNAPTSENRSLSISEMNENDSVTTLRGENRGGALVELTETKKEVENIKSQIGGDVFSDKTATKAQFKEVASKYGIIHLATHALINDKNPMDSRLVFTLPENKADDGFLYAYELFGMRLSAQMVVLSACNTGYGKLLKGEGVQSIARGFAYAGVPSIVMSLWTAQDNSTSQLMVDFYKGLKEGKSKDAALQAAKLAFLEKADAKITAHPFFWAGFVILGDTEPIAFHSGKWKYYVGVGALLVALLFLFLKRKKVNLRNK
jgi:CHAT domain-containing protein